MFDKRLRIILLFLGLAVLGLAARAGQIQLIQGKHWREEATNLLTHLQSIETTRGEILDGKMRVLAADQACMDACVDYPAIPDEPDPKWLHAVAVISAKRRFGSVFDNATHLRQKAMVADETEIVRGQIAAMWKKLARLSGQTDDEMESVRQEIIQQVEMRRQSVAWQDYQRALEKEKNAGPASRPWYLRWLPQSSAEKSADDYEVVLAEQSEPHVVLPAIDTNTFNELAKNAENLPGLVLRPGRTRVYPYHDVACHVIGRLGHDGTGADGVEAMCEKTLRGSPGELNNDNTITEPVPGGNVQLSIDVDVQTAIEKAFADPPALRLLDGTIQKRQDQPGAAVVIDIASGKVLALASYPTYDLNTYDKDYPKLSTDDANAPLLDRATQAYEPGSTVKPMMALGALHDGLITPQSTIECNGYLVINGKQITSGFRCWTMSEYNKTHHEVPPSDPLPTNSLTVVDAIERSCNVFFETVANRMGMVRQRYWYDRFGLGRPTGIGLSESAGHIPNPAHISRAQLLEFTWFAGIGQGSVLATPLQMANSIACIARGGIWMRPTLLADPPSPPEKIDLGFSAEAVAAVKEGMWAVVNKTAGTIKVQVDSLTIAGKSGTAQAPVLTIPMRDDKGKIVLVDGREKRVPVDPNSLSVKSWYIGEVDKGQIHYSHAWFIGYAPAEHPRVAIAVFVEYGEHGGVIAAPVVEAALAACQTAGYFN
jgi:penicillin-binding protein 2